MASLQDYHAREHLINVLKERGIPLGDDDVSWAFASGKTRDQSIAWVKEYLQDATLLSKDELDLVESPAVKLPEAGGNQIILSDASLKAAIESLQVSSDMIDKHARALEAQRDALQAFRLQSRNEPPSHQCESPKKTLANDISRATFTFEESVHTLNEGFGDIDKQSFRAISNLKSIVTERLRADDDVLQALSSLASKTSPSTQQGGIHPATIEQWCQALMMLQESETNSRIDTTINDYICSKMESSEKMTNGTTHDYASTIQSLESEIQTLREEIPSVIELVISSAHRRPLSALMKNSQQQALTNQTQWVHYILDTFQHMINQLNLLSTETSKLHSYNSSISQIREAFQSVKLDASSTSAGAQVPAVSGFTRPTMHSRSSSRATAAIGTTSLADQTLKRFAIPKPTPEALATASEDSIKKMLEQYVTATSSTQELIGKSLDEQGRNMQGTLGQIYAHSQFSSVRLLDREMEREVDALDGDIARTVVGLESAEKGRVESVKEVVEQVRGKVKG